MSSTRQSLCSKGLTAILFILVTFLMLIPPHSAYAEGGIITGKVTKSDGVTPIAGAKIMIQRTYPKGDKPVIKISKTDNRGIYLFDELLSGAYTVIGKFEDCITDMKYDISVETNNITKNVNLSLFKNTTIAGIITEADGTTPLSNVTVSADGSDKMVKSTDETNANGEYKLENLHPDFYWVRAQKDDYVMNVSLPIQLKEGENKERINFILSKSVDLRGKIVVGNNNKIPEKIVIFATSDERIYDYMAVIKNGEYQLKNLPAGGKCTIVITAKDCEPYREDIIIDGENGQIMERDFNMKSNGSM